VGIIETSGLSKVYSSAFGKKQVHALVDLNLAIEPGTIFGLLGPNGAGKTTLVKLLLGISFPTSGSAKILNSSISDFKYKSKVGYLPENHKYPAYLTGGEVLNFYGRLSGLEGDTLTKKIDQLLDIMNLTKWKKTKVKNYSKGMMQRLGLAQALLNDPELIFLDEPTDGVDPIGRKEIRDILLNLKNQNKTIFLNSHLLSEVEMITDRVGILNKGKLLREGTVKELTEKGEEYRISVEGTLNIEEFKNSGYGLSPADGQNYLLKVAGLPSLNAFVDLLRQKSILIKEIAPQRNTLEDMFIGIIKQSDKENGSVGGDIK
jgi:ABC-2 type transport system ATP-binding protein